ncbi:hypothetical protein [Actinophytocola sediminis]
MSAAEHVLSGLVFTNQHRDDGIEPLPLAAARLAASADGSLRYAMSRIDDSGKVPAAQLLDTLGWLPGDRVEIRVENSIIILRNDPYGAVSVARRRALLVPVAARRACGLKTGDGLLLAAAPQFNLIMAHPPAVLDKMMTLYHQSDVHD